MKRWISHILIYLFLGFVTTFIVAWACSFNTAYDGRISLARNYHTFSDWRQFAPSHSQKLHREFLDSYEDIIYGGGNGSSSFGFTYRRFTILPSNDNLSKLIVLEVGWPFRALWGAGHIRPEHDHDGIHSYLYFIPYDMEHDPNEEIVGMPLYPIWIGFLLNSAIFSSVWFLLIFGFSNYRKNTQSSRKKRGLCPKCKYDLCHKFETGCSECGWNRVDTE